MTELKEIAVDMTALIIVLGIIYSSIALIQTSPQLDQLGGLAAMYLFGKYTPNSA